MSHNAVSLSLRPLQANADPSVISCMHNLSRRIAIALQHEERRCQYLTREAKLMLAVQDEVTNMTESESHTTLPKTHHSVLESSTKKYPPLRTVYHEVPTLLIAFYRTMQIFSSPYCSKEDGDERCLCQSSRDMDLQCHGEVNVCDLIFGVFVLS